jgi:hypothetical protein
MHQYKLYGIEYQDLGSDASEDNAQRTESLVGGPFSMMRSTLFESRLKSRPRDTELKRETGSRRGEAASEARRTAEMA